MLDLVVWLVGYWWGEVFGGIVEEVWLFLLGDLMMGVFKLVVGDEVQFYEIEIIMVVNVLLVFCLKYFGNDLISWEEKEEYMDFFLLKLIQDIVYFNGFILQCIDENIMNIYVVIEDGGKIMEYKFYYKRVLLC